MRMFSWFNTFGSASETRKRLAELEKSAATCNTYISGLGRFKNFPAPARLDYIENVLIAMLKQYKMRDEHGAAQLRKELGDE